MNEGLVSPPRQARSRFGFSPGTHWFRLKVASLPAGEGARLLEAGTPSMDSVRVHILWPDGRRETMTAGDMHAYAARAMPAKRLVFPLPEDLSADATILIEAASQGPVRMPLRLWSVAELHEVERSDAIWLGLFVGVFVAMILYNLVLFLYVRDRAYLGYVSFWSAFLLVQLTYQGVTPVLFWPESAGLSNPVVLTALGWVVAAGSQFARDFLGLAQRMPRVDPFYRAVAWIGLAGGVLAWWLPYAPTLMVLLAAAGALLTVSFWVIPLVYFRGFRPARFLGAALLVMAPGMFLIISVSAGVVAETEPVARFIQVSTMLEPYMFALALADRIKLMGEGLRAAEHHALGLQEQFSVDLLRQQEESRRIIAQNLHDSVGQSLLVILNRVKRLARGSEVPSGPVLQELAEIAKEAVDEVRAISHNLHPHQLERLGLDNALQSMLNGLFKGSGIELSLDLAPTEGHLPPGSDIHLFRLAQEAASNVLRHSRAKSCEVVLRADAEGMQFIVSDDGRGLPLSPEGKPFGQGFGMTTMRERARAMGGTLALESVPDEGVTLTARFPLRIGDSHHGAHHPRG